MKRTKLKRFGRMAIVYFQCGLLSLIFSIAIAQNKETHRFDESANDWENTEIFAINKLPARAWFVPYSNEKQAMQQKVNSNQILPLNGKWKFHWSEKPADIPTDFFKSNYDDTSWNEIAVPGNWQLLGYGYPHYVSSGYTFPIEESKKIAYNHYINKTEKYSVYAPVPHDYNPVGCYRHDFVLPENWETRDVIIHFGGVNSAFYLWINGQKVGYSQDSKLPAEFNISKYIKPGKNSLAAEVYQYSDGSYLEDQDFWRVSGIERDVYLIGQPKTSITDFALIGMPDDSFQNGQINANIKLSNQLKTNSQVTVILKVYDQANKVIFSQKKQIKINALANDSVSFSANLKNIKLWSAEKPNLYPVSISLKSNEDELQALRFDLGFRTVKIENGQFLINGKVIYLKGVNRHEHHPIRGHVITKEDMEAEISILKKFNINAVRTAHYPNHPYWYYLCDKYGIYVLDEANLEAHGHTFTLERGLGNDPRFKKAILDRIQRMIIRDRNHPSVIIWSLGNEISTGENFGEAYKWIKANDYRPVQFEKQPYSEEIRTSDFVCPMYATIDWIKKAYIGKYPEKPFVLCEYSHAMGNSNGNFMDYWKFFYENRQLQGGFIWDLRDQGILKTTPGGKKYFAYGGDFEPEGMRNTGNFCTNGIVASDLSLHPSIWEIKKAHQNVWFTKTEGKKNTYTIENRFFFSNLSEYDILWEVLENGTLIKTGRINKFELAPEATANIAISELETIKRDVLKEYHLNFYVKQKEDANLVPKEHIIASEQFLISAAKPLQIFPDSTKLQINKDQDNYVIHGEEFEITISRSTGLLSSYKIGDKELIKKPLDINLWRPLTDNDYGNKLDKISSIYKNCSKSKINVSIKSSSENELKISLRVDIDELSTSYYINYTVYNNGIVLIETRCDLDRGLPELPRYGFRMQLAGEFDNMEYFGRGPHENYWDRKHSAHVGLYQQNVADNFVPYIRPQENGNRSDVRWASFTNKNGTGLKISGIPTFDVVAQHFPFEDLDFQKSGKNRHTSDIYAQDLVDISIDYKQRGVGGDDSWGERPHDQYRLFPEKYELKFILSPIINKQVQK